jgi:hypothetical protein
LPEKYVECPKLTPYWHSSTLECLPPFIVGRVCEQICHDDYISENSGAGPKMCRPNGTWSGQELIYVKFETVPPKGHLNSKGLIKYACILRLNCSLSILIVLYHIILYFIT